MTNNRKPNKLLEDGNSKLQYNLHGKNHKVCIGYSSNDGSLHGNHNGNSHVVVNVASVQHTISLDDCVGNEAEGGHL